MLGKVLVLSGTHAEAVELEGMGEALELESAVATSTPLLFGSFTGFSSLMAGTGHQTQQLRLMKRLILTENLRRIMQDTQ